MTCSECGAKLSRHEVGLCTQCRTGNPEHIAPIVERVMATLQFKKAA